MTDRIEKALEILRAESPLVLCLTNFVTVEFVANSLLALGAAPIMSACDDEIDALVALASAVYINIGTLDPSFIALANQAVASARQHGKPVVLDPVGAGATQMRTRAAQSIVPLANIIRGNASEIIALAGGAGRTKGVETMHGTDEAKDIAVSLARAHQATVIVSGPIDFVTDGSRSAEVPFGSPTMTLVTGMGCAMTGMIAAFCGVIDDPFEAGLLGAQYVALCGEVVQGPSPGTFKTAFIDQLQRPNFARMRQVYAQRG
jgi:hydroxyethylthiazole kinase